MRISSLYNQSLFAYYHHHHHHHHTTTMVATAITTAPTYDRATELKTFNQTKSGVQGFVDGGIINQQLPIPVIDLGSTDRKSTVEKIRASSEHLGVFQVVNHGIPLSVMHEALQGVRRFHEQDVAVKKRFYTTDLSRTVGYMNSTENCRDTLYSFMAPSPPALEELPEVCRDIQIEYSNQVMKLGELLFGLISEALGMKPNHLADLDCNKGLTFVGHCYHECPQPELTMGAINHTDDAFLTVLLQDEIGGLQILHRNQWIDVAPTPGALVINIGDLLQMISNHKLKSVEHRVVVSKKGARISVACLFNTSLAIGIVDNRETI